MRIIKYKGKVARIKECDYKELLNRFDVKIKKESLEIMTCPFCRKFQRKICFKCPFIVFQIIPRRYGCIELMDQLGRPSSEDVITSIGDINIITEKGKKWVTKIYKLLKKLKKVKK